MTRENRVVGHQLILRYLLMLLLSTGSGRSDCDTHRRLPVGGGTKTGNMIISLLPI